MKGQRSMDGNETVVRSPQPEEIDAAVAVWRASNEARTGGPPTPPETESMVRGWMAVPDAILLVAERNGQIMGMTLAVASRAVDDAGLVTPGHPVVPGLCHISLVFVAPGAWGQGIGARLLEAVLAEVRRREYAHVQLWTHEDNVRARRLYVSRGFRLTDDRRVNPAGETIVRFERPSQGRSFSPRW